MDLKHYLSLFWKWAWLLIVCTSLGAFLGYMYSRNVTPTYQSDTTLMVGKIQDNTTNVDEISNSSDLAYAYAQLVTQPGILQATAEATDWPETWQSLFFHVSAVATNGQLVTIRVTDTDPQRAAHVTSELARQLILQSPVSAQQLQAEKQRSFIASRLAEIESRIDRSQKALDKLRDESAVETDIEKVAATEARIGELEDKTDKWEQTYAALTAQLNNSPTNYLTIMAPAQVPLNPISPNVPRNIIVGALIGLVLAAGLVLLLEYVDDTIKNANDVQRVLELTTLGAITKIPHINKPAENLVTLSQQRSSIAEAYRVLRTNLRFSGIENPGGALLVTSATPGEGKTTTAANLAIVLAQLGKNVVLVDTDLRRPTLHKFFELPNELGLSSFFMDDPAHWDEIMQPTSVEGLRVITSGPPPPNPSEILDSKKMTEIIANLRSQFDMVIFDSPPTLAVADASILGTKCSGTILVIYGGHTRTETAERALDTLEQTKVNVIGVVLNKLNPNRKTGYYHDKYRYYSEQPEKQGGPAGKNKN